MASHNARSRSYVRHVGYLVVLGTALVGARSASADDPAPSPSPATTTQVPTSPPSTLTPSLPPPPPPPPPPSHLLFSVSLGLGVVAPDHTHAGCATCQSIPPSIETYLAVGGRLTPWLALGLQGQAVVEFVSGHPGSDERMGLISLYPYGQLSIAPNIDLIGGIGYGFGFYQYSVREGQIITTSRDVTERIGQGPAVLAAARFEIAHRPFATIALEVRATALSLSGSTTPGLSLHVVGGRF